MTTETVASFPTQPLEAFAKMKELRRAAYRRNWETKEEGRMVVLSQAANRTILAGIGPSNRRLYGPYFAKAMKDNDLLIKYHEAAEAAGFPSGGEMCSSMHHYLGEMLLGLAETDPFTGEHSPVDLIFETRFCPAPAKTAQFASELLGVPSFVLDVQHKSGEAALVYTINCMHEAVEFLEKTTGREYNDEWLIEATRLSWETSALMSRIVYANQAVPAPLTYDQVLQLSVATSHAGSTLETIEFYEEALAEVEERVKLGISAIGVETARLCSEGEPLFYDFNFLQDTLSTYGAVIVTGLISGGLSFVNPEGRRGPPPRFADLGITLNNRDDAFDLLAREYQDYQPVRKQLCMDEKDALVLERVIDWKCDGVMLHMDMGCRNQLMSILETKKVVTDFGVPVLTYNASNGDCRSFDRREVTDAIETFMETLGLRTLDNL